MSLSYDASGLPSCCGVGLLPGDPHTECPRCSARYDTQALALQVQRMKSLGPPEAGLVHAADVAVRSCYPY